MNYPKSRRSNIVDRKLENEVLIYDLTINKAYCLNQTSALVYEFADGTRSVSEISKLMGNSLKIFIPEDLVWLALDQLKTDNLLENNDTFELSFGGLSRREVIRKVGFASLVMLPMVSSIVAPTSVMAQSGAQPGTITFLGTCPTGSGCAPGLTCTTCTGGPCGSGSRRCCNIAARPGFGVSHPNVEGGPCTTDTNSCNNYGTSNCCSGRAALMPNTNCQNNFGIPTACFCS